MEIAETNDEPSFPYCRDLHDNGFNGTIPELSILWNLLKLYVFQVHLLGLVSTKAIRPWLLTILEFSTFESVTVLCCRFTWDEFWTIVRIFFSGWKTYMKSHMATSMDNVGHVNYKIVGQFFSQLLKIGLAKFRFTFSACDFQKALNCSPWTSLSSRPKTGVSWSFKSHGLTH